MPLSINVGLSRKASRDYQSTGVSINVTAELDQSLLAKPGELQQQIDSLYEQAEQAIQRQARAQSSENPPRQTTARPTTNGNPYRRNSNGNGNGTGANNRTGAGNNNNGNGNGNGRYRSTGNGQNHAGGMTDSQRRAILSIAQRVNADANQEANDLFGSTLDEITLKQASELIDHLKALGPAEPSNGRH